MHIDFSEERGEGGSGRREEGEGEGKGGEAGRGGEGGAGEKRGRDTKEPRYFLFPLSPRIVQRNQVLLFELRRFPTTTVLDSDVSHSNTHPL